MKEPILALVQEGGSSFEVVAMKTQKKTLTLRQIAKLARTSKSTVSRVLTNHPSVSPKTRERIQSVIKKHGFKPNLFARGLAGGKTGLIAVLTSEINSGFYAEVIKGVDEIASQNDGHVLSSFAHGTDDYIDLWSSLATGGRVDGIILIAPPTEILTRAIGSDEVPLVLCACRPEQRVNGWESVDTVTVHNEKGMVEMLRHVVEQGCARLVHMAGPPNIWDAAERRRSFERFIADHPNLAGEIIEIAMTRENGWSATLDYLKVNNEKPDAFIACNDLAALGILEALKESGIRVPDMVAVTGCDDDAASSVLGLTTLRMPMVELGRETARLLFERLNSRDRDIPARESVLDMMLCTRATSLAGKRRDV